MDRSEFDSSAPGRLVEIAGVPNETLAFVPDPLPPGWQWPNHLWPLLMEAREALATLSGTGKFLPNPELVLRPLQKREAQLSNRLEGTITDPQEQMLFEIQPREPESTQDPDNARREVSNYARALRHRRESQDELPLSLRLIRELHAILMDGVRGSDRDPGRFRRGQNQIGRPARYIPPPAQYLAERLDNLEKYLHQESDINPLVRAFIVHYQFEAIHPFNDGNGRVGRLLLAITITEWCGLSNQWLFLSGYFDRNKDEYIDRLFAVSTRGEWTEWIAFCLKGVVEQSKDTLDRCERLINLNKEFHEKVNQSGGSVRLSSIVDELFELPVFTVTMARSKYGVTYPTAKNDLQKLEEMGILKRVEGIRQITYFCKEILDIIYTD